MQHLPLQTGSSLRVAAAIHTRAAGGVNVTGAAIVNVMPSLDFIAGQIDVVNETRGVPDRGPHIAFSHARDGEDVVVELAWPGYAASRLNCAVDVPVTGSDYAQAVEPDAERPDHLGKFHANLTLAGLGGRLALVECTGGAPTATHGGLTRYPLCDSYTVETDPLATPIPFLEWGTAPNLGAFDLTTLIIVIVSMIGFQRASPGTGVIFGIMVLGVVAYFELIVLETVILGTLALLAMIAIIITRRGRHEVLE